MKTRLFLRLVLLAGLAASVGATPGWAKTVKIPATTPPMAVEIPGAWTASTVKRGLEIKSDDEGVFLWIETYNEANYETIKAEHGRYFEGQGVTVTGEPKIEPRRYAGYGLAFLDLPAIWKGKPTVLRYILVEPDDKAKRRLMMSYWASPEGDRTHDAAMNKLVESLAAAVNAAN